MDRSIKLIVSALSCFCFISSASADVKIPASFQNSRVFVTPTYNGVEAKILVDSGGRSGIYPEFQWYWGNGDHAPKDGMLSFPNAVGLAIGNDSEVPGYLRLLQGPPEVTEEFTMMRKVMLDGILGHLWLAKQVWEFDYLGKSLTRLESSKKVAGTKITMHFKSDKLFYPRIAVKVLDKEYQVLLDTGATSFYSQEAMSKIKVTEAFQASSFIRESIFEKWRKENPTWEVIEKGDRMGRKPLIKVPEVTVSGKKVGPVWFAARNDSSYDLEMANLMDCKCDGAVGGNIFKYFRMTLDYPNSSAWFQN